MPGYPCLCVPHKLLSVKSLMSPHPDPSHCLYWTTFTSRYSRCPGPSCLYLVTVSLCIQFLQAPSNTTGDKTALCKALCVPQGTCSSLSSGNKPRQCRAWLSFLDFLRPSSYSVVFPHRTPLLTFLPWEPTNGSSSLETFTGVHPIILEPHSKILHGFPLPKCPPQLLFVLFDIYSFICSCVYYLLV